MATGSAPQSREERGGGGRDGHPALKPNCCTHRVVPQRPGCAPAGQSQLEPENYINYNVINTYTKEYQTMKTLCLG